MTTVDTSLPEDLTNEIHEINCGLREIVVPYLANLATRTTAAVDRLIELEQGWDVTDKGAQQAAIENGSAELHELFSLVRGLSDPVGQGSPVDWYFYELVEKYGLKVPQHRHIP